MKRTTHCRIAFGVLFIVTAALASATGIEETGEGQIEGTTVGPLSRSQFDQRIQENTWVTELIGYDVATQDGDMIGTVDDAVIDLATGHLIHLAVRISEERPGVGPGLYPLPPYVFQRDADRRVFTFVVDDLDFVSRAPTFDDLERYAATPGPAGGWEGTISGYWNTAPMPLPVERAQAQRRAFDYQYRYASGSVTFPGTVARFSTITDRSVRRRSGQPLGRVTDFAVNFRSGNTFYAELSLEEEVAGNSTYLLPLNAFVLNRQTYEVAYPASEFGFPAAYGYDRNRPPVDSPDWFADARRFWNRRALGFGYPGGMKIVPRIVIPAGYMIGYSVMSADSVGIGELVDALVTLDGRVPYAVVELEGFLGISGERTLLPMNALSISPGSATVVIDIVQGDLEGIPTFPADELPNTSLPDWDEEFREYWRLLHTDLQTIYSEDVVTIQSIEAVEQPMAMPVSAFTSFDVVTESGVAVGTVEDIAIDLTVARAPYAILGVGGFLGIGDTNLAVPLQSFSWDPDNARLILGVSEQTLENAPGFADGEWPLMGNPDLEVEMNDYWSKELGG